MTSSTWSIDSDEGEQIDKADVAFAVHAFMLSTAILTQTMLYPHHLIGDPKHPRRWVTYLLGAASGAILLTFAVEISIDEGRERVVLPYML